MRGAEEGDNKVGVEVKAVPRKRSSSRALVPRKENLLWYPNPWGLSSEILTVLWLRFVERLTARRIAPTIYRINGAANSAIVRIFQKQREGRLAVLAAGRIDLAGYNSIIETIEAAVLNSPDARLYGKREGEKRLDKTRQQAKARPTPTVKVADHIQPPPAPRKVGGEQSAPPKLCPRCRGMMLREEDYYGAYRSCLCCGYVYEFGAIAAQDLAEEERPDRLRRRKPSHTAGGRRLEL